MAELIVALDVRTGGEARRLADKLPGLEWVKLGPMLFLREGPVLVQQFKQRGARVFLDLKWHDIPNSVAEAARAAAEIGVDLATVHALGGRAMIEAAVGAAGDMKIAAVTVLTSHGQGNPPPFGPPSGGKREVGGGRWDLRDEVTRLAKLATEAGAHAVVASSLEVTAVRDAVGPDPWIITPGIRPAGSGADDQQRTATPAAAVAAGSTHLVVGRPIARAENPGEVYQTMRRALS
jgi:orotidine-5'-phosphate decarboxylase